MMKLLFALALVALCQAGPMETSVSTRLQRPHINKVVIRDENFLLFEFEWTAVESGIWTDPLLGYKMRVWEVPDAPLNKAKEYTLSEGKYTAQVEQQGAEEADAMDVTKNLANVLLMEIRTPADLTAAPFFNVRVGINYEIRVAAFTKTHESSYSNMMRIRLLPNTPEPTDSRSITITMD